MTGPAYLPDPARSRAVLIGVSAYTRMPAIPAIRANIDALAAVLTDGDSWGLPPEHCRVVVDPGTAQDILDPIHQAAATATDGLVVYFAGHGLLDNGELELALVGGAPDALHHAVRFAQVRREVVTTARRCRAKVVLLDCCFSGRAMSGFMSAPGPLADHAVIDGTYLMTATAETTLALAPSGERHTAFTGALLGAIAKGVPGGPDPLDMDTLFLQVESELRARNRPIPQRRSRNDGGRIALVRNRATATPGDAPAWTYEQPRRRRALRPATAAVLAVAAAGLAGVLALNRDRGVPQTTDVTSPTVSATAGTANPVTGTPATGAPAGTSTALPKTQVVTASWRRTVETEDGLVQIGLTGVNQDGIFFYVVTPAASCRVKGADFGESTVVAQGDGRWVRFVPLRQLFASADALDDDFDTPVEFRVEWGRGDEPRSNQPCA